jgi:hypothetical protein
MAKKPMLDNPIGIMDPNQYAFSECIERLIKKCDYNLEYEGRETHVTVRRMKSRPYNTLGARTSCRVIMNRGAHWNPHFNSFFLMVAPSVYLINDMISFRSIDKNCSYGQMHDLGMNVPKTWALPQQDNSEITKDPKAKDELIFCYHELFDLEKVGESVGYPAFIKPQDGGGWVGVKRVENYEELHKAYAESGKKAMNLQAAVDYTEFVRTVGIGPVMMPMHYNAKAEKSHDRYHRSETQVIEHNFLTPELYRESQTITKIINAFYGWDHNSCESLVDQEGVVCPIDYANAYPDSSPISLHYYFPELVKAMVRWLIFIAVTHRKKRVDFAYHWPQFFEVAKQFQAGEIDYTTALSKYEAIADAHFDTAAFEHFCEHTLADFDEIALEFFDSEEFMSILEREISDYFSIPGERPQKLAHYGGIFKFWAQCERTRLGLVTK